MRSHVQPHDKFLGHGYTSNEIESLIGDKFPQYTPRVFPNLSGSNNLLSSSHVKVCIGALRDISCKLDDMDLNEISPEILQTIKNVGDRNLESPLVPVLHKHIPDYHEYSYEKYSKEDEDKLDAFAETLGYETWEEACFNNDDVERIIGHPIKYETVRYDCASFQQFGHYMFSPEDAVKEWEPSKYFESIPLADDDTGRNDDVLFYGPNTGQYHSCANSESNMKRAWIKRMLYCGNMGLASTIVTGYYKSFKIEVEDGDEEAACYLYDLNELDFQELERTGKLGRGVKLHIYRGLVSTAYTHRMEIYSYLVNVFIPQYVTPIEGGISHKEALELWICNQKRFTVKVKDAMRSLLNQMLTGTYEAPYHGKDDPMGLRVINIFQKTENYPEVKEPRAISACSTECKVYLGGYYHMCDKHAIKTCPFFVKGLTPSQIDAKKADLASRYSVFMGSDYSSYEGSQDYVWSNLIEKTIYMEWFKNYPEVQKHVRDIYEKGHDIYYRKRFFGHLNGKRMSGDVQTSIGNGICNALIWSYVAHKSGCPVEFLVEGDDAFICSDAPLDVSHVHDLGFDCTIDGPSFNPDDICFLSRYSINGQYFGNIPKILDKVGVVKSTHFAECFLRNSKRSVQELNDYAYTKAYCYQYMYTGTPILDELCDTIMRLFPGSVHLELMPKYFEGRLVGMMRGKILKKPITMEVRRRVAELWPQYSIEVQLQLEEEFRRCTTQTFLINDVVLAGEAPSKKKNNVSKESYTTRNSQANKEIKQAKESYKIDKVFWQSIRASNNLFKAQDTNNQNQ